MTYKTIRSYNLVSRLIAVLNLKNIKKYISKKLRGHSSLRLIILCSALALSIIFATNITVLSSTSPSVNGTPQMSTKQIIVKLKKSANSSDVNNAKKIIGKYGTIKTITKLFIKDIAYAELKKITLPSQFEDVYLVQFASTSKTILRQTFNNLKKDPAIESVQWNYEYKPAAIPNDPEYNLQWSLPRTQSPQGWDITTGSPSAVIAVIGTGVRWDHEDLAGNIWANTGESNDGLDNDGNGYIDDTRGWDFQQNDNNPMDQNGHETAVAGVAAAVTNNSTGITGVCWSCRIMPLRVDFTSEQVASAINYAVNKGAKIIVMSFGNYDPATYGADTVVETAINNGVAQGVLMISSAGNDNVNTPNYPSALSNVIGVAATDQDDLRATFSNWGTWVDVAAPGAGLRTTSLSSYNNITGTSVAAGFVGGIAGLLYSKYPSLSIADATSMILAGVDSISPDQPIGSGRINVYKTVHDGIAPAVSITNPSDGATISGSVNITANAADNIGVTKVEFYLDGNLASTDTSSPYSYTLATSALANGSHTITAKAYDDALNIGTATINVTIGNIPTVTTHTPWLNSTAAQFWGEANTHGSLGSGWFRYGLTNPGTCNDTFGTKATQTPGEDLTFTATGPDGSIWPGGYLINVLNLNPGATYYYCFIVQNSFGKGYGSLVTFQARYPPPTCNNVVTSVGVPVTITGSGGVLPYNWYAYNYSSISANGGQTFTVSYPDTGAHYVYLMDSRGDGSSACKVTVN